MHRVWSRPRQHQPWSKHTLFHPSVTDPSDRCYRVRGLGVSLKVVAHKESQSHNPSLLRYTLRDWATLSGALHHLLTEPGEQVQQLPGKT